MGKQNRKRKRSEDYIKSDPPRDPPTRKNSGKFTFNLEELPPKPPIDYSKFNAPLGEINGQENIAPPSCNEQNPADIGTTPTIWDALAKEAKNSSPGKVMKQEFRVLRQNMQTEPDSMQEQNVVTMEKSVTSEAPVLQEKMAEKVASMDENDVENETAAAMQDRLLAIVANVEDEMQGRSPVMKANVDEGEEIVMEGEDIGDETGDTGDLGNRPDDIAAGAFNMTDDVNDRYDDAAKDVHCSVDDASETDPNVATTPTVFSSPTDNNVSPPSAAALSQNQESELPSNDSKMSYIKSSPLFEWSPVSPDFFDQTPFKEGDNLSDGVGIPIQSLNQEFQGDADDHNVWMVNSHQSDQEAVSPNVDVAEPVAGSSSDIFVGQPPRSPWRGSSKDIPAFAASLGRVQAAPVIDKAVLTLVENPRLLDEQSPTSNEQVEEAISPLIRRASNTKKRVSSSRGEKEQLGPVPKNSPRPFPKSSPRLLRAKAQPVPADHFSNIPNATTKRILRGEREWIERERRESGERHRSGLGNRAHSGTRYFSGNSLQSTPKAKSTSTPRQQQVKAGTPRSVTTISTPKVGTRREQSGGLQTSTPIAGHRSGTPHLQKQQSTSRNQASGATPRSSSRLASTPKSGSYSKVSPGNLYDPLSRSYRYDKLILQLDMQNRQEKAVESEDRRRATALEKSKAVLELQSAVDVTKLEQTELQEQRALEAQLGSGLFTDEISPPKVSTKTDLGATVFEISPDTPPLPIEEAILAGDENTYAGNDPEKASESDAISEATLPPTAENTVSGPPPNLKSFMGTTPRKSDGAIIDQSLSDEPNTSDPLNTSRPRGLVRARTAQFERKVAQSEFRRIAEENPFGHGLKVIQGTPDSRARVSSELPPSTGRSGRSMQSARSTRSSTAGADPDLGSERDFGRNSGRNSYQISPKFVAVSGSDNRGRSSTTGSVRNQSSPNLPREQSSPGILSVRRYNSQNTLWPSHEHTVFNADRIKGNSIQGTPSSSPLDVVSTNLVSPLAPHGATPNIRSSGRISDPFVSSVSVLTTRQDSLKARTRPCVEARLTEAENRKQAQLLTSAMQNMADAVQHLNVRDCIAQTLQHEDSLIPESLKNTDLSGLNATVNSNVDAVNVELDASEAGGTGGGGKAEDDAMTELEYTTSEVIQLRASGVSTDSLITPNQMSTNQTSASDPLPNRMSVCDPMGAPAPTTYFSSGIHIDDLVISPKLRASEMDCAEVDGMDHNPRNDYGITRHESMNGNEDDDLRAEIHVPNPHVEDQNPPDLNHLLGTQDSDVLDLSPWEESHKQDADYAKRIDIQLTPPLPGQTWEDKCRFWKMEKVKCEADLDRKDASIIEERTQYFTDLIAITEERNVALLDRKAFYQEWDSMRVDLETTRMELESTTVDLTTTKLDLESTKDELERTLNIAHKNLDKLSPATSDDAALEPSTASSTQQLGESPVIVDPDDDSIAVGQGLAVHRAQNSPLDANDPGESRQLNMDVLLRLPVEVDQMERGIVGVEHTQIEHGISTINFYTAVSPLEDIRSGNAAGTLRGSPVPQARRSPVVQQQNRRSPVLQQQHKSPDFLSHSLGITVGRTHGNVATRSPTIVAAQRSPPRLSPNRVQATQAGGTRVVHTHTLPRSQIDRNMDRSPDSLKTPVQNSARPVEVEATAGSPPSRLTDTVVLAKSSSTTSILSAIPNESPASFLGACDVTDATHPARVSATASNRPSPNMTASTMNVGTLNVGIRNDQNPTPNLKSTPALKTIPKPVALAPLRIGMPSNAKPGGVIAPGLRPIISKTGNPSLIRQSSMPPNFAKIGAAAPGNGQVNVISAKNGMVPSTDTASVNVPPRITTENPFGRGFPAKASDVAPGNLARPNLPPPTMPKVVDSRRLSADSLSRRILADTLGSSSRRSSVATQIRDESSSATVFGSEGEGNDISNSVSNSNSTNAAAAKATITIVPKMKSASVIRSSSAVLPAKSTSVPRLANVVASSPRGLIPSSRGPQPTTMLPIQTPVRTVASTVAQDGSIPMAKAAPQSGTSVQSGNVERQVQRLMTRFTPPVRHRVVSPALGTPRNSIPTQSCTPNLREIPVNGIPTSTPAVGNRAIGIISQSGIITLQSPNRMLPPRITQPKIQGVGRFSPRGTPTLKGPPKLNSGGLKASSVGQDEFPSRETVPTCCDTFELVESEREIDREVGTLPSLRTPELNQSEVSTLSTPRSSGKGASREDSRAARTPNTTTWIATCIDTVNDGNVNGDAAGGKGTEGRDAGNSIFCVSNSQRRVTINELANTTRTITPQSNNVTPKSEPRTFQVQRSGTTRRSNSNGQSVVQKPKAKVIATAKAKATPQVVASLPAKPVAGTFPAKAVSPKATTPAEQMNSRSNWYRG